jgi:hypothetical protein
MKSGASSSRTGDGTDVRAASPHASAGTERRNAFRNGICFIVLDVLRLSATSGSVPSAAGGEPQGIMSEVRPIPSPLERSFKEKLPPGYLVGGIAGRVGSSFGR